MERLNYNQLYYFYVTACEGSIKEACKKLHLTQPTVSAQLKTLEESLGRPLFDRQHRKLALNAYGAEVFKRAEKIFVIGDEMLASLSKPTAKLRTDIRIGSVPSLPDSFVYGFTFNLWKTHSHSAHLLHGSLPEMIRLLDEDGLDLILSDVPLPKANGYRSINLGGQKLVAVGAAPFRDERKNFPHSLNGKPYLGFQEKSPLQADIEFFFKMNGIKPDRIGSVDDASFIRTVTAAGLCFSILPEMTVRQALANKKLVKLGNIDEVQSNCWAVTSSLSGKKIQVRSLINDYLVRRRPKTCARTGERKRADIFQKRSPG